MRIAILVLAVVGGIVGIVGTLLGLGIIGFLDFAGAGEETTGLGLGVLVGFAAAIVTIVAGALVYGGRAPRPWGAVLIAASIIGFLAAGGFYILGGVLGIIAGILALLMRPQAVAAPVPDAPWAAQPPGAPPGWGPPPGDPPQGGWPPQGGSSG